ncbi:unnamed protein product (macronuclear) [Paramecium tetraurelia]|uniref:Uncharacterized protein n=1 Tax=Paramecium tetraurelia TaxID=5888 RepID=A0CJ60_PARTE|nr:uncharacterized protein GSPATT00038609001 [Paramecium tetraurelia]CAK70827.1 unnamed protein product [Paramecium tetraurelia]|eukprot:XP_001438224.1 hypothetical protein (macronuclear) [Paramecium tetraurelia strain d4-2]
MSIISLPHWTLIENDDMNDHFKNVIHWKDFIKKNYGQKIKVMEGNRQKKFFLFLKKNTVLIRIYRNAQTVDLGAKSIQKLMSVISEDYYKMEVQYNLQRQGSHVSSNAFNGDLIE